ncbi:MAG: Ldh family oxidoreductase [Roseomonas sp.]|nr:Ldh family oxidoreductase [Roseomonas sp.]
MKLTVSQTRALAAASMRAVGHSPEEAEVIADHLLDCELRGLSFGGLARALSVVERIRQTPEPRRPIKVVHETPISATLDGGDQVGYLVAHRVLEMALEKAKASRIAIVGARETWYTGMFSYYLERVTAAGFAGLAAGSGPPRVAPHGGTEGRFTTNPIAIAVPSAGTPVIWDIGTAAIMSGELMLARRLGTELPEGIAFDEAGAPTRDPDAALRGAVTVWGGHKGSGLATMIQLLGMMTGADAAPPIIRDCGFFLLIFDPGLLGPAEEYKERVSAYAERIRATRPLDPAKPVRMPFERSAAERARRLAEDSIEVADEVHRALSRLTN